MTELARVQYEPVVRGELETDLGLAGDLTTRALAPPGARAAAAVVARAPGRICGVEVALTAFELLGGVESEIVTSDGEDVAAGAVVVRLEGSARTLLSAERTALNLLSHLSGVATATAELVHAVEGYPARIVDTRKTTPGLRRLEKYAVRVGGGGNHRFGLYDAVLIKDNHIALAGGVGEAVTWARASLGHLVRLEVEVDDLGQLDEALAAGVDVVLLDNMTIDDLTRAVERTGGRALTEASGGIDATTVSRVAATGVDLISVGWITHSAQALDLGLDLQPG